MKGCPDCERRLEAMRQRRKRYELRQAEMGHCKCGRMPAKGRTRCHRCLLVNRASKARRKLSIAPNAQQGEGR